MKARAPLAVLAMLTVLGLAWPAPPARAHHGFVGHYDLQRPVYLSGTVVQTSYGMPHGRLRLRVDRTPDPTHDPALLRTLEDAEGRQIGTLLKSIARSGVYELTLDTQPSRQVADQPWLLPTGERASVIAYRRQGDDEYRDELLAVALVLNDGSVAVGSARMKPGRRSR